ncbi:hypothetical protein IF2G_04878 [Cordyceps javanica]|nr:hypothetical protein IF2G_04878 [Cordyceps javanica]
MPARLFQGMVMSMTYTKTKKKKPYLCCSVVCRIPRMHRFHLTPHECSPSTSLYDSSLAHAEACRSTTVQTEEGHAWLWPFRRFPSSAHTSVGSSLVPGYTLNICI